ncbi:hypothetical protein MPTK1_7g19590 [Marchantia polymorpha subsp. ruderalis]|uniref:Uncharacterized protein n=2 Tax=Marchantia polymorpha TaxID=3197 RepID=A0AAF6C1H5_MARPO|nr:hypothetical protein MARPO_0067s0018 [Marchantia polymorpha]BBN18109.1 hypothetical protein Mp_7g19590 [Marchantia polymorpha subsp. ruderalis]|eukprot:PTQ35924.1 hypothetical protein MARPO_0067s0018 [Marchantia polymorpha]
MKSPRALFWLDTASLVPLVSILSFSFFLVWQWCSEPPFNPSFPNFRERAYTFPLDQVSALTTIALPITHTDASSHLVSNADEPHTIDEVTYEEEDKCCKCAIDEMNWEKSQRAAPLLHGWNDKEVIRRAVEQETATTNPYSAKAECMQADPAVYNPTLKNRRKGSGRVPCNHVCGKSSGATARVKIAYMFMITTALPFEALWNKYFEGKEGLYNIYVHADPFNANLFTDKSSVFFGRMISSGKADRGSPSLVVASQRLLANAILDDPLNQYFALVSGSCVPIRSFDYGYQMITASRQSFIEQITNETVMEERYRGREGGAAIMMPEIPFEKFRKGAQWYVFIRKHALIVLKDQYENKYWNKFDRKCIIYFCGTDEHYYHTLINIVDADGANGKCVTYVNWPTWVSEHPLFYQRYEINQELIRDLQSKDGGQYLFARKFQEDTADLLLAISDTILQ